MPGYWSWPKSSERGDQGWHDPPEAQLVAHPRLGTVAADETLFQARRVQGNPPPVPNHIPALEPARAYQEAVAEYDRLDTTLTTLERVREQRLEAVELLVAALVAQAAEPGCTASSARCGVSSASLCTH